MSWWKQETCVRVLSSLKTSGQPWFTLALLLCIIPGRSAAAAWLKWECPDSSMKAHWGQRPRALQLQNLPAFSGWKTCCQDQWSPHFLSCFRLQTQTNAWNFLGGWGTKGVSELHQNFSHGSVLSLQPWGQQKAWPWSSRKLNSS